VHAVWERVRDGEAALVRALPQRLLCQRRAARLRSIVKVPAGGGETRQVARGQMKQNADQNVRGQLGQA
jgi:hypothetical protein